MVTGPEDTEPLIVDHAFPTPLSEVEVHAWANTQSVFISSVMEGMTIERQSAVEAVSRVGALPVSFEGFGGRDDDPEDAYTSRVAASDIYVGILGARYGRPLKTGYSATHAEYNEAVRRGLRVSVWASTTDLNGQQRDFLDQIRVFQTTGSFASAAELSERIETRLREMAAESLMPWVKVGNALFRASEIRDDGNVINIVGRIRDAAVVASIENRRPTSGWNRGTSTRITWAAGTAAARIVEVSTETTSSRARTVRVKAERAADESPPGLHDVAFGSRTPEDLTELAVRSALLGEPNPLEDQHMGFFARIKNPFAELDSLGLSQDAAREVAEVLLVEELVGSGRAERITSFNLGPLHQGRRRIAVAWLPRRRYVNAVSDERTIDGLLTATK